MSGLVAVFPISYNLWTHFLLSCFWEGDQAVLPSNDGISFLEKNRYAFPPEADHNAAPLPSFQDQQTTRTQAPRRSSVTGVGKLRGLELQDGAKVNNMLKRRSLLVWCMSGLTEAL
jgi:hypothetical protein